MPGWLIPSFRHVLPEVPDSLEVGWLSRVPQPRRLRPADRYVNLSFGVSSLSLCLVARIHAGN